MLRLQTEPGTGAQTCIVCDQCAKACPDDLIALGGHREPGQKIKVLDYFDFNLSRCSFCGLCSEVCPTKPIKALIMSEDYELGSYSRETQILRVDQMYDGVADRAVHALKQAFRFSKAPHAVQYVARVARGPVLEGPSGSDVCRWRVHAGGIRVGCGSGGPRRRAGVTRHSRRRARRSRRPPRSSSSSATLFLSEGRYPDALEAYQQRAARRRPPA